jgi:hypothetical protein
MILYTFAHLRLSEEAWQQQEEEEPPAPGVGGGFPSDVSRSPFVLLKRYLPD